MPAKKRPGKAWHSLAVVLGGAALVVAARLALHGGQLDLPHLSAQFKHLGPWAPVALGLAAALANLLFIETWPFHLAAGSLLGFRLGLVAVLPGVLAGAVIAFALGRTGLREMVRRRLSGRIKELDEGLSRDGGGRFVLLVRMTPLLPNSVLSYAFGATSVRGTDYVVATAIASVPQALLFTYMGAAGLKADALLPAVRATAPGLVAMAGLALAAWVWWGRRSRRGSLQ